jgi:hypothetical protein
MGRVPGCYDAAPAKELYTINWSHHRGHLITTSSSRILFYLQHVQFIKGIRLDLTWAVWEVGGGLLFITLEGSCATYRELFLFHLVCTWEMVLCVRACCADRGVVEGCWD